VTAFFLTKGFSTALSIAIGVLVAVFGGICNGIGVVYGIRPVLMTHGMGAVVTSTDLLFSNNRQILIENKFFEWLRDATYFGLGIAVYIYLFTFLILFSLFHGTSIGIRAYAVGGNSTAALISGIKTKKYIFNSYVISAVCASISGILILARLSSSTPRAGDILLLDVILAAFMSVIFSRRFMPNLAGVFVSAIFIATLSNAFTLLNFPSYWTSGIKGVIILIVVASRSKKGWVK
jgi:ribose transport system permease protein